MVDLWFVVFFSFRGLVLVASPVCQHRLLSKTLSGVKKTDFFRDMLCTGLDESASLEYTYIRTRILHL